MSYTAYKIIDPPKEEEDFFPLKTVRQTRHERNACPLACRRADRARSVARAPDQRGPESRARKASKGRGQQESVCQLSRRPRRV